MEKPITFPVSLEEFAAYQAAGIGRDLDEFEMEVLEAFVPLINRAYTGSTEWLKDTLNNLDRFIEADKDNAEVVKCLSAVKRWVVYAWDCGRKVEVW